MEDYLISYDKFENAGVLTQVEEDTPGTWQRLKVSAQNIDKNAIRGKNEIRLPWYQMLDLIREFLPLQRMLKFRFTTDESSKKIMSRFAEEYRLSRESRPAGETPILEGDIQGRLDSMGFTKEKRELQKFQLRDVVKLIGIPNGANFSVPGSGKTTVTLAVHLLTCTERDKLLVICPKSAFPVWDSIIAECIEPSDNWAYNTGRFLNLSGMDEHTLVKNFSSENRYFFTNYEHFVSKRDVFSYILSIYSVHMVLDEAHRMKAGEQSQRGSALLSVANLPKRKDILTGTPMPQSKHDIQAQLDFLYPGVRLGMRIDRGEPPSSVIGKYYTRTTKIELEIPPMKRNFIHVPMSPAQSALYSIIRNEALSQLSELRTNNQFDVIRARRSVLRLLQIASNPLLALQGMSDDSQVLENGIISALRKEPISTKMQAAIKIARENSLVGRKSVIWTIFTKNINDLEAYLADLNPVSIYGAVPTGDDNDISSREGRLKKFHKDDSCMVLIANPAAAGEGISLHEACHEAIYLDRSYISTHYLQSIDRIHRLGLPDGTETNVHIIQAAPPAGLGSIDYSVSRRLATKIRALEQLLNDRDLHQIALDEENAPEPIDFNFERDDLEDLIQELESNIPFDEESAI